MWKSPSVPLYFLVSLVQVLDLEAEFCMSIEFLPLATWYTFLSVNKSAALVVMGLLSNVLQNSSNQSFVSFLILYWPYSESEHGLHEALMDSVEWQGNLLPMIKVIGKSINLPRRVRVCENNTIKRGLKGNTELWRLLIVVMKRKSL